jgi:hypothetical protein
VAGGLEKVKNCVLTERQDSSLQRETCNTFSPVCISKCCFKFELSVHPLLQYVQKKGFSPV